MTFATVNVLPDPGTPSSTCASRPSRKPLTSASTACGSPPAGRRWAWSARGGLGMGAPVRPGGRAAAPARGTASGPAAAEDDEAPRGRRGAEPEPKKGNPALLWGGIGAGVIGLVIVVIAMNKSSPKTEPPLPTLPTIPKTAT